MTMKHTASALFTALLIASLAGAAHAAPGGTKGKPGGGGGDPGDGNDVTSVTVLFRDDPVDRVGSDGAIYVNDYDEATDSGVRAFIGTKANLGNIKLWRSKAPTRALWLDFSDCFTESCTPLFETGLDFNSAIDVQVNEVQQDGVWGMTVGTTVDSPMRIWYEDPDNPGDPGFIHFDNVKGGSSPCKNSGAGNVEVTRISDTEWTVSASDQIYSCATLPGRKELAGFFIMPFSFTVELSP
jgi:hypothetical protein